MKPKLKPKQPAQLWVWIVVEVWPGSEANDVTILTVWLDPIIAEEFILDRELYYARQVARGKMDLEGLPKLEAWRRKVRDGQLTYPRWGARTFNCLNQPEGD